MKFINSFYRNQCSRACRFNLIRLNLTNVSNILMMQKGPRGIIIIFEYSCLAQSYLSISRAFEKSQQIGTFLNESHERLRSDQKFTAAICLLAVRHITICGKMVDYISGQKQFDFASVISNLQKILSKNSSVWNSQNRLREQLGLLTVTLQKVAEQRTQARCCVTSWG